MSPEHPEKLCGLGPILKFPIQLDVDYDGPGKTLEIKWEDHKSCHEVDVIFHRSRRKGALRIEGSLFPSHIVVSLRKRSRPARHRASYGDLFDTPRTGGYFYLQHPVLIFVSIAAYIFVVHARRTTRLSRTALSNGDHHVKKRMRLCVAPTVVETVAAPYIYHGNGKMRNVNFFPVGKSVPYEYARFTLTTACFGCTMANKWYTRSVTRLFRSPQYSREFDPDCIIRIIHR